MKKSPASNLSFVLLPLFSASGVYTSYTYIYIYFAINDLSFSLDSMIWCGSWRFGCGINRVTMLCVVGWVGVYGLVIDIETAFSLTRSGLV